MCVYRLGIQRLETTGLLALAHQAMLEEMLREEWTGFDNRGAQVALLDAARAAGDVSGVMPLLAPPVLALDDSDDEQVVAATNMGML